MKYAGMTGFRYGSSHSMENAKEVFYPIVTQRLKIFSKHYICSRRGKS